VLALDEAAALARRGELPPRFELRAPGAAGRARFAPGPARRGALICLLDGDRLALRRALALRGGEALVRCDRAPFADGWRGDVVACALPPRGFDRLAELAPHAATRLGWRAKLALAALRSAAFRIRRAARRGPSPRFTTRAHAIDERTLEISLRDPRGAPAGSTRLERRGDEGYSFATEVAPPYRGLGGGRQLIEAALDVARGQGLARVTAHAAESNRASLAAYRAAGFRPTGRYWSSATQPLAAAERALVELERIC
jgi:ribosomal protein S18 acetylase RimI-like enzyme